MNDDREGRSDEPTEPRVPRVVLVEDDSALCGALRRTLGAACQTLCVQPQGALEMLQRLDVVDLALVDCDQPPSVQAPIFRELARWPHAVCVLMSANVQKVEQLRALGIFAPLVLDKPVQQDALEAIRSATLELALQGDAGGALAEDARLAEDIALAEIALAEGIARAEIALPEIGLTEGSAALPAEAPELTQTERSAPRR